MPGPSNLYGVANPVAYPVIIGPSAQISCPGGTETTIITSPVMAAPSAGYFYPVFFLNLNILLGATAPNVVTIAYKIGAGSDVDTVGLGCPIFYANNWMLPSTLLVGPSSNTTWAGAGSQVILTAKPDTQTVQVIITKSLGFLFRAPDQ